MAVGKSTNSGFKMLGLDNKTVETMCRSGSARLTDTMTKT